MPLKPGDRLGQYEVAALVGAGGMGEVYRAHDTRLGRDVAIKTLPASVAADAQQLARLEREARSLAALNHPNIATVYGLDDHGEVRALVMELVDGPTLAEVIARAPAPGGLPVRDALAIAKQIAEGLDAAHDRGLVHRDLKPANIKITPDHVVKILDFGLAKAVEAPELPLQDSTALPTATWTGTVAGAVLGTLAYMSPEQARGQAVDKRTDIWAFGCVLYEMLAGRPPFSRETPSDTIAAVLASDPDWTALPSDVTPGVRRLVERCLDKNPKRRLRDIGDAGDALESPLPAESPRPAAGLTRRGVLALGGTALGALGLGVAGGMTMASPAAAGSTVTYRRLTFRRGLIRTARFAPDFKTVLYGALWDGGVCQTYAVRPESPESSPLPLPSATPLAVSSSGELALSLGTHRRGIMTFGTLAQVPQAGGVPRKLLERVKYADWAPDGSGLAVVREVNGREQLEFPVGTVIAEPASPGGGFSFPRVSPRGDAVAVFELSAAAGLNGRVLILSRSGSRLAQSPDYFNVFGLAWRGSEVWFTAADELPLFRNAVHAMTTSGTLRLMARIPGNASLHDIAPDGRVLMARTDDRGGISVRAPGESSERDLSWLDGPSLADISPDGTQILFSETGVGGGPRLSTYLRGTDGSPAVRLGDGYALALSPDGKRAVVQMRGTAGIQVIPTGAGETRHLELGGLTALKARWLPDGRHVVVRADNGAQQARVYLVDADGSTIDPVTPMGVVVGAQWAVSPDGKAVAISTDRGVELHQIAPGSNTRTVPGTTRSDQVVGWIDTGLLVSIDPVDSETVFRVDPGSGQRTVWKEITARDPTGIMNLGPATLVVTPSGHAYGYGWHRAISDLYLVEGLA